jgi:hypothetical protein
MEKKEVIKAIAKVFEEKIAQLNSTLEGTSDRARDAPGSNVSHSDTSKFQLSNLALGFRNQVLEYQRVLGQLKDLPAAASAKIGVGSLFVLSDVESNEKKIFMMLSQGGGEEITVGEDKITTLSVTAPIAQVCLDKEIDDEIEFGQKSFEVIDVM